MAQRIGTYMCVPYEWNCNWSQDVEKCTLDLVLSFFTHTNTIQAIALASKECWFFLLEPLVLSSGGPEPPPRFEMTRHTEGPSVDPNLTGDI